MQHPFQEHEEQDPIYVCISFSRLPKSFPYLVETLGSLAIFQFSP